MRTGAVLALFIGGVTLAGLFFLPGEYNAMDPAKRFSPPGISHFMGTDNFGRDVFSRIIAGAKYTLFTALLTVAGSAAAGTVLGLFSGFTGGIWDEITMRLMDTISSFPGILLAW